MVLEQKNNNDTQNFYGKLNKNLLFNFLIHFYINDILASDDVPETFTMST